MTTPLQKASFSSRNESESGERYTALGNRAGSSPVVAGLATGAGAAAINYGAGAATINDPGRLETSASGSDRLENGAPVTLGEMVRAVAGVMNGAGAARNSAGTAATAAGTNFVQVGAACGTPVAAMGAGAGRTATIGTVRGGTDKAAASALSNTPRSPMIAQVALAHPNGQAEVVRTGAKPVQLPNASLFQIKPAVEARYLVETDARFADYRQWTGSDYMTAQIALDP
jgi:hypothetical protein